MQHTNKQTKHTNECKLTIFIEGALSSFHWDPIRKTSHWQSQVVEYFLAIHLKMINEELHFVQLPP